jgi:hypothetical protein
MRHGIAVVAAVVLIGAGTAQAQQGRVIDTTNVVGRPVDTTTTLLARTTQQVTRSITGFIDNSELVKFVNNLFGQRPKAAPVQGIITPLPDPKAYPSTYYKSPIQPVMPIFPKR